MYGMNPQVAQQKASDASAAGDLRASAEEAGYLELEGAQKDADCQIVNVPGGISTEGGCCNLWDTVPKADAFKCGTCTKIKAGAAVGAQEQDQNATAGGSGDTGAVTSPGEASAPQGM